MVDNQFHIDQIVSDIFGEVKRDMGGGELRFICPFHDDHNPSCDVNPEKGVYVCRACGKSGSLFDLAKERNYDKILPTCKHMCQVREDEDKIKKETFFDPKTGKMVWRNIR